MAAVPALDLITDAFAELNVFLPGESLPNVDAQAGLRSLNGLLGQWAQQSLTIPSALRSLFTLVVGQGGTTNPYTLGPGGTFDTPQLANVESVQGAALLITGATEIPVTVMGADDWMRFPNKDLTGAQAVAIYYDPTLTSGLGTLYVWPVPTVAQTLVLYLAAPLVMFADLTTAYQLPLGYRDGLVYELARRLATPYGREVTADLMDKWTRALGIIKRSNLRLTAVDNYFGGRTGLYDIRSDGVR